MAQHRKRRWYQSAPTPSAGGPRPAGRTGPALRTAAGLTLAGAASAASVASAAPAAALDGLGPADVGRAPAAASARPYSAPERAAAVAVSFARAQLGRPWRWGGTGPDGYDCSGLVQAAWRAAGLTLPRTSYRQLDAGPRVDPARPAPGDLVFCHADARHVGLYAGGGRVVQVRRGERVAEVPLAALPVLAAVRPAPLAPLARWP